MSKVMPTEDRLLVLPITDAEVTPKGLIIPEAKNDGYARGKVVARGPGKRLDDGHVLESRIPVGSLVYFTSGCGIRVDGVVHVVLPEKDVIAVELPAETT